MADSFCFEIDFITPQIAKRNFRIFISHPIEIKGVDDFCIGIAVDVNDQLITLFIGVNMMKCEKWIGLDSGDHLARLAFHDVKNRTPLRLPFKIFDERLDLKQQRQWLHHQRKFR